MALCAMLVALLPASPVAAQLRVRVEGAVAKAQTLSLPDRSHLSDAALAAQVLPQAYSLGAAWLRFSQLKPQTGLKAGVLFDLTSLGSQALLHQQNELATLAADLHDWIEAMPVTGRTPAMLDPRAVEITPDANMGMADSDRLYYPLRPSTVRIVGAVQQRCELPLQPLQDARLYLASCTLSPLADPDWIYVIEPDGRVFRQGIALWNRSPALSLAPGAMVYVPIREGRAATVDPQLNHDLAAFLATQILPGPGGTP
ncbi:capsule biosynthesis GfcC family protein [Dyella flava]|uniref:Capsule biosynthesis GfcC family protein n=2 Tax=Dyella flava TaxID=1920170 RepID=A0ABS2JYQ6_9GAMM|nr:capsule biosynthesis GfcC family protein [Dyella flava]